MFGRHMMLPFSGQKSKSCGKRIVSEIGQEGQGLGLKANIWEQCN
jgi:hypothetical protein